MITDPFLYLWLDFNLKTVHHYILYIKILYPPQKILILSIIYHHISTHFANPFQKIVSPNSLGKSSSPFFCWEEIDLKPSTKPWGQGAFGSVYEARDVKSMQMVVCKVPTKNNQQMTNQPNHPKKRKSNTCLWFGLGWWKETAIKGWR